MGVCDSSSIAILCSQKATEDEKHDYPRLPSIIKKAGYADNITILSSSIDRVIQDLKDMIIVMDKHNLDLHKFIGDNPIILNQFSPDVMHPDINAILQECNENPPMDCDTSSHMVQIPMLGETCVLPDSTYKEAHMQMVVPAR